LQTDLIAVVGEQTFVQGVEARQQRIDESRARLAELRMQSQLAEELTSGDLVETWPEPTLQEKRTLLHGLLDRVLAKRSDGRKAGALPLPARVQIVLRGNVRLSEPESAA
jgi:hypothetical protein